MKKKVLKMGPKLGFYFFGKSGYDKGDLVQIVARKNKFTSVYSTKFNRIVTIRRQVEKSLDLKAGDIVDVEMSKIKNMLRVKNIFYKSKIDLLVLVPLKTSQGYEIIVTEFTKYNEKWLRLWYSHSRGSGRQLEIRRFVDIEKFGALLGQYQAEGTKESKKFRNYKVEFCNKLIAEHLDFYKLLLHLGIKDELIFSAFYYNPKFVKVGRTKELIKEFESKVTKIKAVIKDKNSKGSHAYKIRCSNTVFWELFNNSMNIVRERLASKIEIKEEKLLAASFLAKLLTGDGTLDSRTFNRNFPDVRIRIVDQNPRYLEDYMNILKNLGFFSPKIDKKHILVKTSCSFENLSYLYDTKAFKNTGNWNKILVSIALCLEGRRMNTYYRFLQLDDLDAIRSEHIANKYKVTMQAALEWLDNKSEENLLVKIKSKPVALFKIAKRGHALIKSLSNWRKDYELLQSNKSIYDP